MRNVGRRLALKEAKSYAACHQGFRITEPLFLTTLRALRCCSGDVAVWRFGACACEGHVIRHKDGTQQFKLHTLRHSTHNTYDSQRSQSLHLNTGPRHVLTTVLLRDGRGNSTAPCSPGRWMPLVYLHKVVSCKSVLTNGKRSSCRGQHKFCGVQPIQFDKR